MTIPRFQLVLYIIAALLALVGLAEATYLTALYLTGETAVCGGSASCSQVLGSAYARIAGIPVSGLGALAYFTAFSFATFAARHADARCHSLVALRAGVSYSCILPILSFLGRIDFPAGGDSRPYSPH
jgi:uncharacterized membrane protein